MPEICNLLSAVQVMMLEQDPMPKANPGNLWHNYPVCEHLTAGTPRCEGNIMQGNSWW
jgi:hypothetical protein